MDPLLIVLLIICGIAVGLVCGIVLSTIRFRRKNVLGELRIVQDESDNYMYLCITDAETIKNRHYIVLKVRKFKYNDKTDHINEIDS